MSIQNGIVSSKVYETQGYLNFEIVDYLFLDDDVTRSYFYGVDITQLIHFPRMCSDFDLFNMINLFSTVKISKQAYR